MPLAVCVTHNVRARIIACLGTKSVVQLEDPKILQNIHVVDDRVGLNHPAQKASEALTCYLASGLAGLQEKYGTDHVTLV